MPYNFTHALLGHLAAQQSNPEVSALAVKYAGAFYTGTMGPDPYFGDAMPRPLFSPCRVDLAEKLHSLDARVLFGALLPLAAKDELLRAYALGFLCHFLLDTTAHPYIEARFSGSAHTPMEIQTDFMMTDRYQADGIPRPPRAFYHTARIRRLDALHAALAQSLFGSGANGVFLRGYRKWIMINTISYDPKNRKLRFFNKLEKVLPIKGKLTGFLVARHDDPGDRLNLSHAAWSAPWDAETRRTESFLDLFEHALSEGVELLNAAYTAMETGEYTHVLALIGARRMDARPV